MRPTLEKILDRAYAGLNWWLEGLWIGLPARARSFLFVERATLVVRIEGETAAVHAHNREPMIVDVGDGNARAALAHLFPEGQAADATVLLPRGLMLTHTLRLPNTVETELQNVLRHELDRLTPFEIDDVVYDYRIRERDDTHLVVDFAVARQVVIDDAVAALERLGLRATVATTEDAHGVVASLNLLRRRRRLRLPAARLALQPMLGIVSLALLCAALYLPMVRYDRVHAEHTVTVETARMAAVSARAKLTEQEAALASGEFLAELRGTYVPPVALLRELTEQIPAHTWLSRFSISRDEVQLHGESAASTELLQLLEATVFLQDVRFQAPVSRTEQSGKEQFTIFAKLEAGPQ